MKTQIDFTPLGFESLDSSGGKHMETLEAFCYTCQTTVEVHGYWHDEWDLVEPPDADAPDHHNHDVSIEGRA